MASELYHLLVKVLVPQTSRILAAEIYPWPLWQGYPSLCHQAVLSVPAPTGLSVPVVFQSTTDMSTTGFTIWPEHKPRLEASEDYGIFSGVVLFLSHLTYLPEMVSTLPHCIESFVSASVSSLVVVGFYYFSIAVTKYLEKIKLRKEGFALACFLLFVCFMQ